MKKTLENKVNSPRNIKITNEAPTFDNAQKRTSLVDTGEFDQQSSGHEDEEKTMENQGTSPTDVSLDGFNYDNIRETSGQA